MKFLLDTHVFLWWINADKRISDKIISIISDVNNDIFLSSASCWEVVIKSKIGKLSISEASVPDFINRQIIDNQIIPLAIDSGHALNVYNLPDYHRDPFDKIIISQAIIEELPIITADNLFSKYPVKIIW